MLRNFLSKTAVDSLSSSGFNISSNPVCIQSVRWRRKPRWLPMAKSKLFKIPVRPVLPPEEKDEWLRLNQNYRTQMRSVRAFFREERGKKEVIREQESTPADEEAEFQRVYAINEAWNLQIEQIRDARIENLKVQRRQEIEGILKVKQKNDQKMLLKIEERVRKEQSIAGTFITRDNIDKAIEEALANPVDLNFSIDLQGNIYRGSERPGDKKPDDGDKVISI